MQQVVPIMLQSVIILSETILQAQKILHLVLMHWILTQQDIGTMLWVHKLCGATPQALIILQWVILFYLKIVQGIRMLHLVPVPCGIILQVPVM